MTMIRTKFDLLCRISQTLGSNEHFLRTFEPFYHPFIAGLCLVRATWLNSNLLGSIFIPILCTESASYAPKISKNVKFPGALVWFRLCIELIPSRKTGV